jgi:hypothetical protein
MIPGVNVLAMAHQLISYQTFWHSAFKGNVEDTAGIDQPTYFVPVKVQGSVQPTPRTLVAQMGWDLQKDYITIYSPASLSVRDVERGRAADMVDFKNERYNVESNTDWTNQDGWRASVCVKIGPTPP